MTMGMAIASAIVVDLPESMVAFVSAYCLLKSEFWWFVSM